VEEQQERPAHVALALADWRGEWITLVRYGDVIDGEAEARTGVPQRGGRKLANGSDPAEVDVGDAIEVG
jgi:hypothetical protein